MTADLRLGITATSRMESKFQPLCDGELEQLNEQLAELDVGIVGA